jgi:hypothetical protein
MECPVTEHGHAVSFTDSNFTSQPFQSGYQAGVAHAVAFLRTMNENCFGAHNFYGHAALRIEQSLFGCRPMATDGDRYRWLRSRLSSKDVDIFMRRRVSDDVEEDAEDIDGAIDDAMRSEK